LAAVWLKSKCEIVASRFRKSEFMKDSTLKILTATLKADETVTSGQRSKILKLARGEEPQSTPAQYGNGHEPRIYSREETAKILGNKSQRYVDLLCKRGLLQKFIPKGNRRAIGVHSESLMAFIAQ
jgi:hypothetical protein